eukprot:CAMPEP_0116851418 /NCGR_PEP_ID=MMETSP0418-20121206/16714_1 /TAXON_ID=1158023 /ORGANISM="Astrosyne radiata, Strain 13vi08-1A" /LENGTH=325 /DNA_ID=CAMNT_0004483443 /DNA_START=2126 /DNA_END=3103 /DNA_ORIENTATION=+
MERLEETSHDRIKKWTQDQSKSLIDPSSLWNDRLTAALGVAEGLRFMYDEYGIVHRDIKPGKVGFDSNGTPKIFDFGLANNQLMDENENENKHEHDTSYHAGQAVIVGTIPYMAPEMARAEQGHDPSKADVYSFAMVLWEMFALKGRPFWNYDKDEWIQYVVNGHQRSMCGHIDFPEAFPMLSDYVKPLLQSSWHPHPARRPSWAEVTCVIARLRCHVQHELHRQVSEVPTHCDTHQSNEMISQVIGMQDISNRHKSFVMKRFLAHPLKGWKRRRRMMAFGPHEHYDGVFGDRSVIESRGFRGCRDRLSKPAFMLVGEASICRAE